MTDMDAGTYERACGAVGGARRPRGPHALESVRQWMPRGQMLPEHILRRRHRTIVWLMWLHVVGLTAFGLFRGQTVPHMILEGGALAFPALLATTEWLPHDGCASRPRRSA